MERLEDLQLLTTGITSTGVLPPPAPTTTSTGVISYGPTLTSYNSNTQSYQTSQTVTTTTNPIINTKTGVVTPSVISTQITTHTIPIGYKGDALTPVGGIGSPSVVTTGNTTVSIGPLFAIYDATIQQYQTAQLVTTTVGSKAPVSQISYNIIPIGYKGDQNVPAFFLPASSPVTSGSTTVTAGPTFAIYDATNQSYQTAQPITTTVSGKAPVTQISYSIIAIGYKGATNIPATPILPPAPVTSGNTTISYGLTYVIQDATNQSYQTAQPITTTVSGKAPVTQISYNIIPIGQKGGTISTVVIAGAPSATATSTGSVNVGPTFTTYDSTTRSYQTAQVVTTTTNSTINSQTGVLTPGSTTSQINSNTIPLGFQGDTIIQAGESSGPPPTTTPNGIVSYGPLFVIYDATIQQYQTAEVVTTTTNPTFNTPGSTTSQTSYNSIPLGTNGDAITPVGVLAAPAPTSTRTFSVSYGPIYVIYDATTQTYESAEAVTTTTFPVIGPTGIVTPGSTTTQINNTTLPLGYKGDNNTPAGLFAAPPIVNTNIFSVSYGVTYAVFDATTQTYQTAEAITTTTASVGDPQSGRITPPVTTTQINYNLTPFSS